MIRKFLVGLVFVTPVWAAETVAVTSGEHEGFTRLVLRVKPSNDWSLKQGNRSAELIIAASDFTFNDSGIFNRIAKDRVLSTRTVEQNGSSVFRMNLACSCEVKAFEYLDTYIVIDIFDDEDGRDNVTELAHETTTQHRAPQLWTSGRDEFAHAAPSAISSVVPQAPRFFGTTMEDAFSEQTFIATLDTDISHDMAPDISTSDYETRENITEDEGPASEHIDADDEPSDVQMATADDHMAPTEPEHDPLVDERMTNADDHLMPKDELAPIEEDLAETVAMARSQLLQQLTMAADQGLLDFDGPIPLDTAIDEPEEMEPDLVVEHQDPEPSHPLDDRQLTVQSVYNRDAGAAAVMDLLAAHNTCPTDESLDIASWGSGENYSQEVSALRTVMLREFDEPDMAAVTDLVHLYIRYGFGVEAVTYLTDYDMIPNRDLLADMAAIVDGNSATMEGPISNAMSCDGIAGLWAVVGTYPAVDGPVGDVPSIISAFAEMPIDIRRMLGPRLVMAFLGRELLHEASIVSDILERAPGDHGDPHTLSLADIALDHGSVDEAEGLYQDLVEENTDLSIDALIRLADITLNEGRRMTSEVLNDLGAAADEARGTQKGTELRRLEALWAAELIGGRTALALLTEEISRDSTTEKTLKAAATEVLWGMSLGGSPDYYVETVSEYSHFIAEGAQGYSLRTKVARELLQAGLPNVALEMLQIDKDPDNSDGRLVAARANLQMYRPDIALAVLADVTGDEARLSRVEANLGLAHFDEALTELTEIENQEAATIDPAWFSGNWKQIAAENTAAAEILNNYSSYPAGTAFTETLPVNDPETLREVQEILDNSTAASSELAAVLGDQ